MDKKERKRLEELQKDGQKEIGGYLLEKLTYPDLQLLLLADTTIQDLIRQIAAPPLAVMENEEAESAEGSEAEAPPKSKKSKSKTAAALIPEAVSQTVVPPAPPVIQYVDRFQEVIKEVIKQVEVRVEVPVFDPLRAEVASELTLLKAIKADAELAEVWVWADENEGRQLVRLLAMLSDWDEVLGLWLRLANRCKSDQRAATRVEQTILQAALQLHNLRYRDRAAELVMAEVGASFHHETMERGSLKGSTVSEVWLPGLKNAAGHTQKKPVVKTTT